ncbi:MAG: hypothetical protein HYZ90_00275 [Candidatus Omnitrophica bacterium]|nr:hypothetical protein [Candidatus Omnitrophota bacterium]
MNPSPISTTIEPALLYSILCDDVRREENGKFILIGLFETIGAREFPALHPALFIVNGWIGGAGTFRQYSRILDPGGQELARDQETSFQLATLKARHSVIARFGSLELPQPGEYAVEVLLNGDLKVRYPLVVEQA